MKRFAILIAVFACGCATKAPMLSASDPSSMIQQAITLNESANQRMREALAALDQTPEPPSTGAINLSSFQWQGKKLADPDGLPSGARYGEGTEGGRRTCQWLYSDWILHAVFSGSSASGSSCKWYHFTRTSTPHPGLSQYRWVNTHQTPDSSGAIWYRWAK